MLMWCLPFAPPLHHQDKRIAMVVTTEMAARGLDVAHLTHVVNYDLPTDADHYVHRAGR